MRRDDRVIRVQFGEFCGSQTYVRFTVDLRRVVAAGRPLMTWQRELWQRFLRSSGLSVPERLEDVLHVLRGCELAKCDECRDAQRKHDWFARQRVRSEYVRRDALVRTAFRGFCQGDQYARFTAQLERVVAVKRPMLSWARDLWAAFVRWTPLSVPEQPDIEPHVFHEEQVSGCEACCRRDFRCATT